MFRLKLNIFLIIHFLSVDDCFDVGLAPVVRLELSNAFKPFLLFDTGGGFAYFS